MKRVSLEFNNDNPEIVQNENIYCFMKPGASYNSPTYISVRIS